jgi:SOS-response transcriptional repressors (RecA-mediated autopeptidases)
MILARPEDDSAWDCISQRLLKILHAQGIKSPYDRWYLVAVVERRIGAVAGELVVAIVDSEFTLKHLVRDESSFFLRPANPAYAPIRPKGELQIFGVVVGLIRKYR